MTDNPKETITHAVVQDALPEWSILGEQLHGTFRTGSFVTGTEFVGRIADLAEAANHHPDVDLRYGLVHVRMVSHDVGGLTQRDVDLATRISEAASALELPMTRAVGAPLEIAIDALDIPAVTPFWRAVLGYKEAAGETLVDPAGIQPDVWFQQMDEPRPQRNRVHIDVLVHAADAEQRLADTVAAGGRLVSDSHAPAFWVLADPEGNEACICTWQGRQ